MCSGSEAGSYLRLIDCRGTDGGREEHNARQPEERERRPGTGTKTGYGHPTVGHSVGPYQLPVPGRNYPDGTDGRGEEHDARQTQERVPERVASL